MNWESQIVRGLKARREAEGITASKLGKIAGINPSAISKIDSGGRKLALSELIEFSDVLGIKLSEMFADLEAGKSLAPPPPSEIEVDGVRYVIADGG